MATTSDHDLITKNDVKKGDGPRPHADGCVGCRRECVCVKCGKSCLYDDTRCISGACTSCCSTQHRHAKDDRNDLVLGVGA